MTLNIEKINNRPRSGVLWLLQENWLGARVVIGSPISRGAVLPIVFFLVAGIISPANAQTETGTVYGSVADPTGAVVPNAVIRLIDIDRGLQIEVPTGSGGFYTFASVRPGHYRME